MKGLFIVMEGPDGSGKTTQINLLEQYLKEAGYECLITREPGGTVIGEEVRELILNPEYKEMSPVTEMLLYAASRAQLVHEVIGPALEAGRIVISDRFVDSSIVYRKKSWDFYGSSCKCTRNRYLSSRWDFLY